MSEVVLLERDAFEKAFNEDPSTDLALRKGFNDVVKGVNVEERTVDTLISTGTVDRDNDVIDQKKWDIKAYKKNPVVQWAHNHYIHAIAQSVKILKDAVGLRTLDKFPPEEMEHAMANLTFNLVVGKYIRAKSVGFRPDRDKLEWDDERRGFDFNGQELLEHSYCNVPANPETLVGAKAAGIDLAPMIEWAKSVLDTDDMLWLPRDTVERALKIAEDERSVIQVHGFKLIPASHGNSTRLITEIECDLSEKDAEEKLKDALPEIAGILQAKLHPEEEEVADPDLVMDVEVNVSAKCGVCGKEMAPAEMESHECEGQPSPYSEDAPKDGDLVTTVKGCFRCREDHEDLKFMKLFNPVGNLTHWANCPKTGEPILLRVEVDTPDLEEEADDSPTGAELLLAVSRKPEEKKPLLDESMKDKVRDSVAESMTSVHGRLD